jgi:RimJ/RimL family protein N-acetyltransferase
MAQPDISASTALATSPYKHSSLVICTPRLELIAATLPLIEAELAGGGSLSALLNAAIETWPPPLNDQDSLKWTVEKLRAHPEHAGFYAWYIVLTEQQKRMLVGLAAFKGPPDEQGTIEAGYSVLESYQKRGIGTEATLAIMRWAFGLDAVKQITAETFPDLKPSIRVMERCGMTFLGEGSSEQGTIRYGVTREQFGKLT